MKVNGDAKSIKNLGIVDNFVMKSLDKKIEKHGFSRGLNMQLGKMRKLRFRIGTVPLHFITETMITEIDSFEWELKKNLIIADNECIGAYNFDENVLIIYLVNSHNGVKLM